MVYLNELGAVCTLGNNKTDITNALLHHPDKEYLTRWGSAIDSDKTFYCGAVSLEQPLDLSNFPLGYQSRNNQLAYHAFEQIASNYKALSTGIPFERIAVIIGTSTSGIKEGEYAAKHNVDNSLEDDNKKLQHDQWPENYHYQVQEMCSPADFIANVSGAKGPVYAISTACSSSAKALASAKALIESDVVDLVICGGVDTLSQLPNNGFNTLESITSKYCNPLSESRDGINIGEGCALFIMSKTPSKIYLAACGETSDAYHISAPHPEGKGAQKAMQQALTYAGLNASDIDYINLHGTATPKNDEMECRAVAKVFGDKTPCSSTKRFTGHTLGAAGALEAGILWLLLSDHNKNNAIPRNKSDFSIDPMLTQINVSTGQALSKLNYCLSNSFAFGGNNISIILGKNS